MSPARKRGRPPLPANERRTSRVNARLDRDEANLLARVCRAMGASESDVLRLALQRLAAEVTP